MYLLCHDDHVDQVGEENAKTPTTWGQSKYFQMQTDSLFKDTI